MQMKKFINDPDNLTTELLEGLALANPDILELGEDNMVINKKLSRADRVTIVTQAAAATSRPSRASWARAWWTSTWWATSSPRPARRPASTPSSWPTRARACSTSCSTTPATC